MHRPPKILGLAAAIVALASAAACSCSREEAQPAELRPSVTVTLATAGELVVPAAAWAAGRTAALHSSSPGTKILGRVERVTADEGQRVARGALLASLESRDLAAALAQAEAGIAMAEARLEQARLQEARMRVLAGRGSATAKNLEDAVAALRLAEAGLVQAEADTRVARVMLSYAEVRSPIAGWVVARHIETGDMARPGEPLFTIEDLSSIEVRVEVPESEIAALAEGDAATVEVLGLRRPAAVRRIVPAGDRASRTFRVELRLDNADGRLKSGMYARARFAGAERAVLAVPRSALVRRGQLDGIFVAGDGGVLRLRWVTLGAALDPAAGDAASEPWVEVLSGLTAGERYAVVAPDRGADGARYAIREGGR